MATYEVAYLCARSHVCTMYIHTYVRSFIHAEKNSHRPTLMHERMLTRGLRAYPYPRVYPYPTRTRGSGTGRVRISRVGSGTGRVITGTGIPGFTRADVKF